MTDHKEILKTYNAWRRDETGGKTLEDFGITPKMVGEAIDAVLADAGRYQKMKDAWSGDFLIGYLDSNVGPSQWDRFIDAYEVSND